MGDVFVLTSGNIPVGLSSTDPPAERIAFLPMSDIVETIILAVDRRSRDKHLYFARGRSGPYV